MKNKITQKILLAILSTSFLTLPAYADDGHYGLRNSINAGFRLTIPFGPTKRIENKIKYGLQMSFRREINNFIFRNDGHISGPQIYNADIMSLNFSENGFKSLSFAGRDTFIYKDGLLRAAASEEEGGMSGLATGLLIGAGVVVAGIGGLLIYVDSQNFD